MNAFFARLTEPSTHAALAGLAGVASQIAVQFGADPHTVATVGTAAASLFGILGVFLSEGKGTAAQGQ
ncbi:hypothetical protein WT29_23310 [Burkholderia stagnalis]|uniref:Holin n=1 Tax=Burkholderia stagnalis TaxID=1503054 RepID=A0A6L3MVT7_9BURK|nr:hypothetical protein [Burkholderia stagnalis]KAB0637258.1 hypothetical protein F7R25_15960 [Burkholderia stagnalis]KVW61780.1 hypothetical protein WT28_15750 [Burkholderia stagnalis]KVW75020.1 hypothetical protein WT29_23310 [Burkholderia stagnalis]KVX78576.1 hypothetical protein WT34_10540 [Burkholderia stagnalis]KWN53942.1 hypothetical protein WT89_23605 [Burkholderia stagnalis]